jgi:hypothetical protein
MKRRKFKDVRKSKLKHQIVDGNASNKDSDLIRDTVKCLLLIGIFHQDEEATSFWVEAHNRFSHTLSEQTNTTVNIPETHLQDHNHI